MANYCHGWFELLDYLAIMTGLLVFSGRGGPLSRQPVHLNYVEPTHKMHSDRDNYNIPLFLKLQQLLE